MRRCLLHLCIAILPVILGNCIHEPISHVLEDIQEQYDELPTHTHVRAPQQEVTLEQSQLSLYEAILFAIRHNSDLQARLEQLGVAQADLQQAGLFHNPETDLAVRKQEGSPGHNVELETFISASDLWQVPLRSQSAARAYEAMQHDIVALILDTVQTTKKAYIDCIYAEEDLKIIDTILQENLKLQDRIHMRYEHGYHNKLDLAFVDTRVDAWRIARAQAQAEVQNQYITLENVLGLPHREDRNIQLTEPFYIRDIHGMPSYATLRERANSLRPEIRAQEQRIAQYQREKRFEQSRVFPRVDFGASFEQELSGEHLRGPALSLDVPIFDANQAQISRAEYLRRHAQKKLDALYLDIDMQIAQPYHTLSALSQTITTYTSHTLERIQEGVTYAQTYSDQKRLTVPTLINTRQSLYETERTYLRTIRDTWHTLADLERAVGAEMKHHVITSTS